MGFRKTQETTTSVDESTERAVQVYWVDEGCKTFSSGSGIFCIAFGKSIGAVWGLVCWPRAWQQQNQKLSNKKSAILDSCLSAHDIDIMQK